MDKEAPGLPQSIVIYGSPLIAVGKGKYPYDCIAKDKYPNAMIYMDNCSWTHEYASDFLTRDKTKDSITDTE